MYGNQLNNSLSASVCGGTAIAKPEVVAWVDSLGYATERLMALAGELESRLSTALSPRDPETDGCASAKAGCQLAGSVQSRVFQLNSVEESLNSILRRLEI